MNSGLYQLVIELRQERVITVGRHGRFSFPAGYYVYTGSAVRNLESRIARHLRKTRKRLRWHIDYLVGHGQVLAVKRYRRRLSECQLNRRVERLPDSKIIAPGFGSSDCKCPAHLFCFQRNPERELGSRR